MRRLFPLARVKDALLSDLLNLSEEQRIRLLVSSVTDYAIYLLDPEGMVASWNPGAERFKGYSASEIVGQHYSRFFTPEDVASDLPGRALRSADRDGRYEAEGWRLHKGGSRFWVHAVIDPIRGEDGQLIGFAKITRDVTDRKRAQDELDAAREALAQSQKLQALGELTGGECLGPLQGHENGNESFGAHVGITTSNADIVCQRRRQPRRQSLTSQPAPRAAGSQRSLPERRLVRSFAARAPARNNFFSPLALEGEGVGVWVSYLTPMNAEV